MHAAFICFLISLCFAGLFGCTKGGSENSSKNKVAHDRLTSSKHGKLVADVLKEKILKDYPSAPIGRAFDGYGHFKSKEWKEKRSDNGKYFIDFIGWFDPSLLDATAKANNVASRGIDVKFVIYPDGAFGVVMVSKLDLMNDGSIRQQALPDIKAIMDCVYANKKISF